MGDRTFVCLWVMKDDAEIVTNKINDLYGEAEIHETDNRVEFYIDEVNYGELEIQDWAEKRGIPYSYRWESGGNYGPGCHHLRFDEKGAPIVIRFSENELELDPTNVYELLVKAGDQQDIHEAYCILYSFLEPFTEKFIPLEWETQERNKLIARTVNLISSN